MTAPLLDRWWVRTLIVLGAFFAVAAFMDTGGTLGTDSGAKVATLVAMDENQTSHPDIGYWAEALDPDGVYHPFLDTHPNDRGEWVHVTTLPMLLAARPLVAVGGIRTAMILPMLGALLAAAAAADLARQVGSDAAGRRTFWLVALASPVTIYALDFWEHAPGVGLMTLGTAAVSRIVLGDERRTLAAVAGLSFGLAAAMRSEAYIVGAVTVGLGVLWLLPVARVRAVLTGGVAASGFAAVFVANAALDRWLGGNSRTSRAVGRLDEGPFARLGERFSDAATTWFGTPVGGTASAVIVGGAFVAAVVAAHLLLVRGETSRARIALAGGGLVLLIAALSGPAFVPGALVASPVALATVAIRRWDRGRGHLLATALASTVLIWTFQILGGAGPQWGGRYLLAPTVLLTVLGSIALDDVAAWARRAHLGLAVAVTLFGLVWMSVRTHDVARFFDRLEARPEPVLIASDGFLLREGGPAALDESWLSLGYGEPFLGALDIAAASGADEVGLVSPVAAPPEREGWRATATTEMSLLGAPYYIHTYVQIRTP